MHYCQTARYSRRFTDFGADDKQGASVAHTDFLRAILRYATPRTATLFGEPEDADGPTDLLLRELQDAFPSTALSLKHISDMPQSLSRESTLIYLSGVFVAPTAMLRSAADLRFPICGLTHSLDVSPSLFFAPGTLLWMEESDALITSSEAGKRTLLRVAEEAIEFLRCHCDCRAHLQVPRIISIPLGVESDYLRPHESGDCRDYLGIPQDRFVLLYSGRLNEATKADLEPLFLAFRRLRGLYPDCMLIIAGHDGPTHYGQRLEAMIVEYGLGTAVRIIRNYPYALKPLIYGSSDIVVLPSDNVQETFGLAVIEAMSCGRPVVASAWSGYKELVRHETTGFLVPTFWNENADQELDTLGPLLSDTQRRRRLARQTVVDIEHLFAFIRLLRESRDLCRSQGDAGRKVAVQEYSWQHIVKRHIQLWEELFASACRRTRVPISPWREKASQLCSHYASQRLGLQTRIDVPAHNWHRESRLPQAINSTLASVAELCRRGGCTVGALMDRLPHLGGTEIAWLVKKGWLEIADQSDPVIADQIEE